MDLKITPEQFREVMDEQLENQRIIRKQDLRDDLKAFAIVVICVLVMCIAAELDSPLILFVFVLGAGIYIMLKVKPQKKRKKRVISGFDLTHRYGTKRMI
jgi:Flp pilus assembly protein TadB